MMAMLHDFANLLEREFYPVAIKLNNTQQDDNVENNTLAEHSKLTRQYSEVTLFYMPFSNGALFK